MSILKDILKDHYEEILYILHPRDTVIDNINRMLNCGDSAHGGAFWGCPDCGKLKFVPYTCKSRFCPSCGNMYNQKRSFHISCKLISCVHRHCVFTIPEELRSFFLKDRSLLGELFLSVRDAILRMFSKMNKTENFTPGFVCVLHSFGRDLKWNPHIHALISEGGAGNIKYDGNHVTFHYNRHEDGILVTETVPVLDFIKRLIVHIPEKHFKMLRYYGIYAKHHKQEKNLRKCLSYEKRRLLRSLLDWRQSILLTFGYDPLRCPECGTSMLVLEVYHKKTALFEQYRKSMGYG
jgi:hypothetical protein